MEIGELLNSGWHVSQEGYKLLSENGNIKSKNVIVSNALNTDIKDFGEPFLNTEIKQNKTGKIILQIQKIRNVAAPKSREDSQAAPRMLKLTLTDGHTSCQAIETSNMSSLSRMHTPPGSKLLIDNAKISSNCILVHLNCCTLLGGKVPALYEKWVLLKNISETSRPSATTDGPPPWVNFGEKIISCMSSEPFKSLASKTAKETTNEFDVHRQDAIAVASSGAVKKVFGGGVKNAQIQTNQLSFKQKYNNKNKVVSGNQGTLQDNTADGSRNYRGKREIKEKNLEKPQKPPERISLFDFLEDKLPVSEPVDFQSNNSKSMEDNNFPRQGFYKPAPPRNFPDLRFQKQKPYVQQKQFGNNQFNSKVSNSAAVKNNFNPTNWNRNTHHLEQATNIQTNSDPVDSITKNFERVSMNTQFASRSLRQHLLGNSKSDNSTKSNLPNSWNWKVGDLCMAKYWEDGKYYNATVTNLTERTCVVKFSGYGNVEEILKEDCIPISDVQESHHNPNFKLNFKGSKEYRNSRPHYGNNRPFNKPT